MLKLLAAVVAAVLSLVLAGPAWGAATISVHGGEVLVAGSDASEDLLLRATDERVIVRGREGEFAATIAGAGCVKFTEDVSCFVGAAGMRARVALGGGADRLEVLGTGEGELSAIDADLGAGDDRFDGSLLDETIAPGPGSDLVDVGEGDDTVTYEAHGGPAGLRYTGGADATVAIGADADALSGAERIVGTPRADSFTGGPGAETLLAGAGDDTIDVTGPGRSAPDTVDCGSGRDSVAAQAGYDTVVDCEVVNGIDSAPVTPVPEPPVPAPPIPVPPLLPPLVVLPPPGGLNLLPNGIMDIVVRCTANCAGQQATIQPPAVEGKGGLPGGWAQAFEPVVKAADRDELLRKLAEGAARTPAGITSLASEMMRMKEELETMNGQADKLERQARKVRESAAKLQEEARQRALETARELQRQGQLALDQARMAAAAAAIDKALLQAAAEQAKRDKLETLAKTKLDGMKKVTTPLDPRAGRKPAKPAALTAAARRRDLGRWLARRAAVALPRTQAKLRATQTPGVYRARVRMPVWLRGVSRTLRRGGTQTLPLRVRVGSDTASVHLRLRR